MWLIIDMWHINSNATLNQPLSVVTFQDKPTPALQNEHEQHPENVSNGCFLHSNMSTAMCN